MGWLKDQFKKAKKAVTSVYKEAKKAVNKVVDLGKKIVKPVTKTVGKVVQKSLDVGKDIVGKVKDIGGDIVEGVKSGVKSVGKFMGKLGPIGTMAIAFIAPYAFPAIASAMAGSSVAWISSVGKGLQAFGSAVSAVKGVATAPFKALGNVVGAGIDTAGTGLSQAFGGSSTMVGRGVASITEKMASTLGYTGGEVATNVRNIFSDSLVEFDKAFGTSFGPTPLQDKYLNVSDFKLGYEGGAGGEQVFDMSGEFKSTTALPKTDLTTPISGYKKATIADAFTAITPEFAGVEPLSAEEVYRNPQASFMQESGKVRGGVGDAVLDKKSPLSKIAKSLLAPSPTGIDVTLPGIKDVGSSVGIDPTVKSASGQGSMGRSFYSQKEAGLRATEDYIEEQRRMFGMSPGMGLLSRGYA